MKIWIHRAALAAFLLFAFSQPAMAQFTPCGTPGSLAVSPVSASLLLPTCGPSTVISNLGPSEVFIATAAGNATATPAGNSIPPGQTRTYNFPLAQSYSTVAPTPNALAAITASGGSATLRVEQGIGNPNPGSMVGSTGGSSTGPSQTASNATGGQATSATNQQSVVWTYGWNSTTSLWDQVYVDSTTHGLFSKIVAPLPAGTNTIGNTGGLETAASAITGGGNRVMGADGGGLARDFGMGTRGELIAPNVNAAGTTTTKCSLAANSATATCNTYVGTGSATAGSVICPAATNLQSEEVRTSVALVGLSLVGNTLTTATDGTGTGTPDVIMPTANALYTLPVPQTNNVTGYNPTASAAIIVCIQKARQ